MILAGNPSRPRRCAQPLPTKVSSRATASVRSSRRLICSLRDIIPHALYGDAGALNYQCVNGHMKREPYLRRLRHPRIPTRKPGAGATKTIIIAAAVLALARPALGAAAWNAKTSHEEYVAGDAAVIAAIIDHEEKNGYVASYASDETTFSSRSRCLPAAATAFGGSGTSAPRSKISIGAPVNGRSRSTASTARATQWSAGSDACFAHRGMHQALYGPRGNPDEIAALWRPSRLDEAARR
jgi:hypothetical protein